MNASVLVVDAVGDDVVAMVRLNQPGASRQIDGVGEDGLQAAVDRGADIGPQPFAGSALTYR